MNKYLDVFSVWDLYQKRLKLNLNPQYIINRRSWSIDTCRSFVEGIFCGYDSAKLYFAFSSDPNYDLDVIDGTQRLISIYKFIDNRFRINLSGKDVSFYEISNSPDQAEFLWNFSFDCVEYDSSDVVFLNRLRRFISRRPEYIPFSSDDDFVNEIIERIMGASITSSAISGCDNRNNLAIIVNNQENHLLENELNLK